MSFPDNIVLVLDELTEDIKNGKVAFFLGAGVSMDAPSNLPNAKELITALIYATSLSNEKKDSLIKELEPFRFELIMDELPDVMTQSLLEMLKSQHPNDLHNFFAECLSAGNTVLTTNFDVLIEIACENHGNNVPVHIPFRKNLSGESGSLDGIVIKLHGSLPFHTIPEIVLISFQQFGVTPHLDIETAEVLEELSKKKRFVFLGYSGSDDFDLMPKLYSMDFTYPLIWVKHAAESITTFFRPEELDPKNDIDSLVGKTAGIKLSGNTRVILNRISSYLKGLVTQLPEKPPRKREFNATLQLPAGTESPAAVRDETLGALYGLIGRPQQSLEWYTQRRFDLYPDDYDGHIENYGRMIGILLRYGAIDYVPDFIASANRLMKEAPGKVSARVKGQFHLEIAQYHCQNREFLLAETILREASEYIEEIENKEEQDLLKGRYLALTGHIETEEGSLNKAIQNFNQAYEILIGISPEAAYRCHSDRGLTLFRAGQYREALEIWEVVLHYYVTVGKSREVGMLEANRGFAYAQLGYSDEAINSLETAQNILERWYGPNTGSLMMLYYRLATLYWNVKRSSKSKDYIIKVKDTAIENGDLGMSHWCEKAYEAIEKGNNIAEQGDFTFRVT